MKENKKKKKQLKKNLVFYCFKYRKKSNPIISWLWVINCILACACFWTSPQTSRQWLFHLSLSFPKIFRILIDAIFFFFIYFHGYFPDQIFFANRILNLNVLQMMKPIITYMEISYFFLSNNQDVLGWNIHSIKFILSNRLCRNQSSGSTHPWKGSN